VEALTRNDHACIVIGGGIRDHEPLLEFFEENDQPGPPGLIVMIGL
jgi:hypothetical protein